MMLQKPMFPKTEMVLDYKYVLVKFNGNNDFFSQQLLHWMSGTFRKAFFEKLTKTVELFPLYQHELNKWYFSSQRQLHGSVWSISNSFSPRILSKLLIFSHKNCYEYRFSNTAKPR